VIKGLFALPRRLDEHPQIVDHLALADVLLKGSGSQRYLEA